MRPTSCLLQLALVFSLVHGAAASMPKLRCPEKCGNLTVSYPFGIGKGCYLNEFFKVSCNASSHTALLPVFQSEVNKIGKDYLRILAPTVAFSYNSSTGQHLYEAPTVERYFGEYYSFSRIQNKFVVIGCDIFAYIKDDITKEVVTGCLSICNDSDITPWISSSSCLGNRCCQAPIAKDLSNFSIWVHTVNTHTRSWSSDQCGISMIVEKNFTDFDQFNLSRCDDSSHVPLVLDWAIGNMSCREARRSKSYTCGQNSKCIDSRRGFGYQCTCSPGYQGNAYLHNGCQDINECDSPEKSNCPKETICENTPGSFVCTCPPGYYSNSSNHGPFGCVKHRGKKTMVMFISLGVGLIAGLPFLVAAFLWIYRQLKKREKKKAKKKFFKRNGGLILQQQMASIKGSVVETKVFVSEELEKATDNFNESRVLGKGGLGTVYKGMLSDGSIVAVKKSNKIDGDQVSQFINEVLILSQISHRHIVKLLGCCLETEVPLLVYEYVANGTLSYHLHDDPNAPTITWENRLRIAAEVAGALAYLHSYASTAIFHRDMKSTNILLDENYRAVISDFGLSRSVPIDKTHLTTLVGGTFGYLDPEYFRSGQLNDKSDVYAFGVVLAELITGQTAISSTRSDEGLVIQFRESIKENRLFDIVEKRVAEEGQEEEILAVAKLAKRCLKLNARKRPYMKEVAAELEQLRRIRERSSSKADIQEVCSCISERSLGCTVDIVTEDSQEFF